jgi:hypothetical protein
MMIRKSIGDRLARFRQINLNKPNQHHDALEFSNGTIVLDTQLAAGQRATVLQLPACPIEEKPEASRLQLGMRLPRTARPFDGKQRCGGYKLTPLKADSEPADSTRRVFLWLLPRAAGEPFLQAPNRAMARLARFATKIPALACAAQFPTPRLNNFTAPSSYFGWRMQWIGNS